MRHRSTVVAGLIVLGVQSCTVTPDEPEPVGAIVFSSNRSGRFQLYTCAADGSDVQPLAPSEVEDTNPRWSPTGDRLAFIAGETLSLLDLETVTRTSLDVVAEPTTPLSWSPQGDRIVCESDGRLVCVDVRAKRSSNLGKGWLHAAWMPGSEHFLATRGQIPLLQVMTAEDDFVRLFFPEGLRTPLIPQLVATWSSTDPPRVAFSSSPGFGRPDVLAYDVFVAAHDGSAPTKVFATDESDWAWDWSPDGKALLVSSETDDSSDLFIVWVDERREVKLTNDAALERGASWRP